MPATVNVSFDKPAIVTGRVVDQLTGRPLAGIAARLQTESDPVFAYTDAITDGNGGFRLLLQGKGLCKLWFERERVDFRDNISFNRQVEPVLGSELDLGTIQVDLGKAKLGPAAPKASDPSGKPPAKPGDEGPPASVKSAANDGESAAIAGQVISDPSTIAAKLTEIRNVARRHEKRFENLRVNGTFEPKHEAFLVVVRDGKYRHDREVVTGDGRRVKSYWLDDGKTAFSFSENLLVMDPTLGEGTKLEQNLPAHLAVYLTPQAGPVTRGNLSVSQYCDALLAALGTEAFGKNSVATLRLRETGRQTVISIELKPDHEINDETAVTLDADRNYVMTRYWDRSGTADTLRQNDVHSEYRELAPGVFFLSKGTWWQKDSGKGFEERGEAHEGRMSIAIDSVEFGDFPVSDTFFDVHHWPPIKPGINVYDNRAKPPLQFVYDKGPFDAVVLQLSLPK